MRAQVQFRLLVVRLGAMGDILHALPGITALRKEHPEWHIGWAVEPRWRALLSAEAAGLGGHERGPERPIVDGIHEVPNKDWAKNPFGRETLAGIRRLRSELRAQRYDAVLDVQGALRSAVVARLSGCHRIVGSAAPREAAAKWLYTERVKTDGQHVIEHGLELAGAVAGDLILPTRPWLPVDAEAERWCDRLESLRMARYAGKPVVLIHPGAGWGAKRWPPDRYGMVAEEFHRRGAVVLVNAGPGEMGLASEVAGGHSISVVESSLAQLIALTRRVSLVIGGDSGPLHLACALGKPVVAIFGPTDPKRNGPYGCRFRVLRNPDSRTDHSRLEPPEAGLLTIGPEQVIAATVELLLEEREARMRESKAQVETPADRWGQAEGGGPVWEAGQAR